MLTLNLKADLGPLHKSLQAIGHKQVPFANAVALTRIAQAVQEAERHEIDATFDKATPFTENAFAILPAKKAKPVAIVFAKDQQATYFSILLA